MVVTGDGSELQPNVGHRDSLTGLGVDAYIERNSLIRQIPSPLDYPGRPITADRHPG